MNKIKIMSSFFVGMALLLSLTSCGFEPMYGKAARQDTAESVQVAEALGRVAIRIIPDESGQTLRNHLVDRFYRDGYPVSPAYTLKVEPLRESRNNLDITKSSESTRAQLRLGSKMAMTDAKGNIVLERDLFAIASFNVLESEFATRVTEQKARDGAIADLARQIERNITLYFNR